MAAKFVHVLCTLCESFMSIGIILRELGEASVRFGGKVKDKERKKNSCVSSADNYSLRRQKLLCSRSSTVE